MLSFEQCTRPVTRSTYAKTGFSLMLLKYAIDLFIARVLFDRHWSPLKYLIWPDGETVLLTQLGPGDRQFGLIMLAMSLPFIIIGTLMTYRRLKSAGLPPGLLVLFFFPVINLFFIALLCLAPEKHQNHPEASPDLPASPKPGFHFLLAATFLSSFITVLTVWLGAQLLANYGFGLFVGAPFAHGFFSVIIYGWKNPQPLGRCLSIGFQASLLAFLCLFIIGLEGAICLIMFLPLGLILAFLGSCFGYLVQARPWMQRSFPALLLVQLTGLPLLMGMETALEPEPILRRVDSSVLVLAEQDIVWDVVVAFPPIPDTSLPWYFRTGVAYPLKAEIEGEGVGAIRKCVFSTGPFVEPITHWEKPLRLAFDVKSQPCPMHEMSPYKIHPPHLDNYLRSQKGEFRLVDIGDGMTRLEATTWYSNRMWPQEYWGLWSDAIIHQVHLRVLNHIRKCAREKSAKPAS